MGGLNKLTISEASAGIREKKFSVTELVSDCLDAIKEKNGGLNAYLEVFEDALDEARKADSERAKYKAGEMSRLPPLFGIPFAIKDNIFIAGRRCTAGSKMLENYIAAYDATAITKLKNQGAIFLGKTNLDEFAMGVSTENSSFGPTKNPRDLTRVPGGSSGGSAAAVAANLCVAALGSDTGGSIRQPAAFCGIVGLKPTYGRISRHGLIAMASSLDVIGPLTKTVKDAALVLDAIQGGDNFDATSVVEKLEIRNSRLEIPEYSLKNIRVGIPKEYFIKGMDAGVEKVIHAAAEKMEKAGAKLIDISMPHMPYALPAYYIIVPSEISANLARYDGIRYGRQHSTASLYNTYTHSRQEALGSEVKRRIMLGTYTLSAGYYDAYYLQAQKVRRLVREDFEKAFERVDVIVGPTAPGPAFRIGEKVTDPVKMYLEDIYTVAVNLAGVPAVSIPAGSVEKEGRKLPVGLQIIGKWFGEKELLGIAESTEKILT